MIRRPFPRPSAALVFVAALLLALAGAGIEGGRYYRNLTPDAGQSARVGEVVELGGVRVQVRSFTVAASLPAEDPERPPIHGPSGSVMVLVIWSQQIVDPAVRLDEHFCDTTLIADDGTIWSTDGDYSYALRRPEALTCSDSSDRPLVVGTVREIGSSFVIPARYAQTVRWRLSFADDRQVVEFRR